MSDNSTKSVPSGLLRPDEAASLLRLSKQRLAVMRLTGAGPAFIKAGRSVLYDARDIDDWLSRNRRASTSQVHSVA